MKPQEVSAAPHERYIDFLCHPFGILFCYGLVSIIMTSLRDCVGRGFCVFYPPRPSDTPQEGNFVKEKKRGQFTRAAFFLFRSKVLL